MECNCEILNITQGTDISLKVTLTRGGEAFPVELSEQVAVAMVSERGERVAVDFTVGDEGRLLVTLRSDDFRTGRYGLEVVGILNGAKWRAFGQSVVRYTFETVKGAERVAVQGDEYDVTLDVGLVSDIVPKRTSELLNDGEDGEHPFATEQAVATLDRKFGNYIPTAQKGVANGVASLNAEGKVPTAQAQFAMRGNLVAADINSTALQSGFYRVIGQRLGSDILGGDEANGVLIQYSDGYKEQMLMVGRTAGAAAGEQVETYTRRYLPTPKRWTAWSKAAGGGGSNTFLVRFSLQGTNTLVSDKSYQEIQEAVRAGKMVYAIYDDAVYILGYCQGGAATFYLSSGKYVVTYRLQIDSTVLTRGEYLLPDAMSQAEAEAGSVTVSRAISPSVLKGAILYHTSDLVNGGAYNSTSKKIELKHGSTVVAEIDATPFIVDGMVDDVRIENGNLVIDFNTESGKQDIAIPLTDIFDPSNYYTKQQTDGLLSGKASTADVTALQQQVDGKQDTISDLAEIRSGAAAGATAVQTETDPTVPVWAKQAQKPSYRTSELTNDGDGQSPFATEDYVRVNGGKIDVIKYNGTPLEIVNKAVDIPVPAPYDDTAVRELITTEITRATTAENNLDTTKVNKSEMTVVAGTGANADKTTITLKSGTSATVLTQHQDISGKEDKMRVVGVPTGATSLAAQVGKYYKFADDLGTFDITLPTPIDETTVQTIVFYMTMGSAPAITISATQPIYYHDGFELGAGKTYEVNGLWNGAAWVVASIVVN